MSNIEISRELAIQLLQSAIKSGNEQEKEELRKLLYPEPVTVKDYMDAGRGDEIKPGMWVESITTGTLFILRYVYAPFCKAFNMEWGEGKVYAESMKPRFDLRPTFAPNGKPFPIEDTKPQPEPATTETPETGLFGCWATHPKYGRGLVTSDKPDRDGSVLVDWPSDGCWGRQEAIVPLSSLTFDPATLTTEQDYADAPNGTIVEAVTGAVYVKDREEWCRDDVDLSNSFMFGTTRRVVRWGRG